MIRRLLAAAALGAVLVAGIAGCGPATPPDWRTDFTAAQREAKEAKKPLLVVFGASWCGYCTKMEEQVWPQPGVKAASEKYVVVKVDGDASPELMDRYMVSGFPTILALDAEGKLLGNLDGYAEADRLIPFLDQWADGRR